MTLDLARQVAVSFPCLSRLCSVALLCGSKTAQVPTPSTFQPVSPTNLAAELALHSITPLSDLFILQQICWYYPYYPFFSQALSISLHILYHPVHMSFTNNRNGASFYSWFGLLKFIVKDLERDPVS